MSWRRHFPPASELPGGRRGLGAPFFVKNLARRGSSLGATWLLSSSVGRFVCRPQCPQTQGVILIKLSRFKTEAPIPASRKKTPRPNCTKCHKETISKRFRWKPTNVCDFYSQISCLQCCHWKLLARFKVRENWVTKVRGCFNLFFLFQRILKIS